VSEQLVAFLRARYRDVANDLESEVETKAPLFRSAEEWVLDLEVKLQIIKQFEEARDTYLSGKQPQLLYQGGMIELQSVLEFMALPFMDHPDYPEDLKT